MLGPRQDRHQLERDADNRGQRGDLMIASHGRHDHVERDAAEHVADGSRLLWERSVVAGLAMAVGTLALFRWELGATGDLGRAQSMALTTMVHFRCFARPIAAPSAARSSR